MERDPEKWLAVFGQDHAPLIGESGGSVGVLLITCPVTGKEFSTGIETDEQSLDLIPDTVARSICPHCGDEHAWSKLDARLSEDGSVG
jgi:hypothetical protein